MQVSGISGVPLHPTWAISLKQQHDGKITMNSWTPLCTAEPRSLAWGWRLFSPWKHFTEPSTMGVSLQAEGRLQTSSPQRQSSPQHSSLVNSQPPIPPVRSPNRLFLFFFFCYTKALRHLAEAGESMYLVCIRYFSPEKSPQEEQYNNFPEGSVGKGFCHQAWWPEIDHWDPRGGRREPILESSLWPPLVHCGTPQFPSNQIINVILKIRKEYSKNKQTNTDTNQGNQVCWGMAWCGTPPV